jgi:hypothetical protein
MTFDYQIAAIPTLYRGRQYRSRLEAKWAAFFDLAGWSAEYEPFDLGGWSPDFILHGHRWPILVEVKPIVAMDEAVGAKMAAAATAAKFKGELLLLGVSPFLSEGGWLGWLDDWCTDAPYGGFSPANSVRSPDGKLDFCSWENSYMGRITGAYDGTHYLVQPAETKPLWDEACNAVQWHCKASAP